MKLKKLTIFRGKKAKIGPVHTMNIRLDDLRAVFFPRGFYEKYKYLGSVPWKEEGKLFQAMEPLIIFMDHKARPQWCPRWFLRFLHLFGNDNSIVRVRNYKLHDLFRKLTKGIFIYDYKTKWEWYDLRISISGDAQMNNLADMIESDFYRRGQREDLIEELKKYVPDPERKYWGSNESLIEELEKLREAAENEAAPKKRGRKKKTEE